MAEQKVVMALKQGEKASKLEQYFPCEECSTYAELKFEDRGLDTLLLLTGVRWDEWEETIRLLEAPYWLCPACGKKNRDFQTDLWVEHVARHAAKSGSSDTVSLAGMFVPDGKRPYKMTEEYQAERRRVEELRLRIESGQSVDCYKSRGVVLELNRHFPCCDDADAELKFENRFENIVLQEEEKLRVVYLLGAPYYLCPACGETRYNFAHEVEIERLARTSPSDVVDLTEAFVPIKEHSAKTV